MHAVERWGCRLRHLQRHCTQRLPCLWRWRHRCAEDSQDCSQSVSHMMHNPLLAYVCAALSSPSLRLVDLFDSKSGGCLVGLCPDPPSLSVMQGSRPSQRQQLIAVV